MEPISMMLLATGLSLLVSGGTFAGGIAHAENLTKRQQALAQKQADEAEARAIAFANQQESRANAQLEAAMQRKNPYGSNTADKL